MYIQQCTTTLTQSLICHLKDPLGKVGKLGTTIVGALGMDGSWNPTAPRQSASSNFSVSFFFSSLSTVMMKTLEAKTFVEGNGMKTRMRTRARDASITSLSTLESDMKYGVSIKVFSPEEIFLRFISPLSPPLFLSLSLPLSVAETRTPPRMEMRTTMGMRTRMEAMVVSKVSLSSQ